MSVWKDIVQDLEIDDMIDETTVSYLETLAPGVSSDDDLKICGLMSERKIFAKLTTEAHRNQVLLNLRGLGYMIPSLYTFFESLKYIEPCAGIMRQLAQMKGHASIKKAMWSSYIRTPETIVEYAERDWRPNESISDEVDRAVGYQQIWLFTMRHFPHMANVTTRKDKRGEKPNALEPNPILWQRLGELSCRLGFQTATARKLRKSDGS